MHPLGWMVWVGAAVTLVTATRNPLVLALLVGACGLILDRLTYPEDGRLPALNPWRFALFVIPVGAVFNGLTSHFGQTVLIRLPAGWPLIGGAITAEALVFGMNNGLILSTLVFTFAVLNLAVPVGDLIQYIPRAFYPFAVVSAIAVSFIPTTRRQIQQVRDAQAIRGHRMQGLKDWLPLFVPVLVGGLERALQLAESMTSRGFAGTGREGSAGDAWGTSLTVTGLLGVLGGVVLRLVPGWATWSIALLVLGGLVILFALWRAGRTVERTRYDPVQWTRADSLAAVFSILPAAIALSMKASILEYSPYPALTWPPFNFFAGLAVLGFTVPAWLVTRDEVVNE